MPKLNLYDKDLDYSYALGIFPSTECLKNTPERCLRLLLSTQGEDSEGIQKLRQAAEKAGVRVEYADHVLQKVSRKGNCFAAMVFKKAEYPLERTRNHLVLHNPSDAGNMGTILRTALGFGFTDVAIIRPAVDSDDPHVIRASMGAAFSMRIRHYDSFEAYRAEFPEHQLFPFMLTGSVPLNEAVAKADDGVYSLIMGNEATGLPDSFSGIGTGVRIPHSDKIDSLNLGIAASIGMYMFTHGKEGQQA